MSGLYHLPIHASTGAAIPYRFLEYQTNGPLAVVTIRRSDDRNRIDPDLAAEIRAVCQEIRETAEVRVLVLTGYGDCFSAGREPLPQELVGAPASDREAWLAGLRVADALATLPIPVIVGINGDALDHGLELALAGDIRLCAEGARLGITDLTREGCFPWDGGTQRLPRLVGPAWANDMILTSRIIDAKQAQEIGLVNRVVPPEKLQHETHQLAETIARGGPIAARYAKEAVYQGLDLPLPQGLRLEADLNIILQSTRDRAEGLRSFTENRPPRFTGR